MNVAMLIERKRDGGKLTAEEIRWLIGAYSRDEIPDYQMSAMAMAIFFRGLAPDELATWTEAMMQSGTLVDLAGVPGAKVDKHSTGGVGDKVSLCLAPLVAACGVRVPMVSGRGLGHTGGTLDKLQAIPGFQVDLGLAHFVRQVEAIGLCMIGQTASFDPADRKLYALRDVTGTVASKELICSSIMSKKLAEGIDGLVLDVKVGSGAFMKTMDDARALARTMIGIGQRLGKRVRALLTDMSQPLGRMVGNALEAMEAIEVLRGQGPPDLVELTHELAAEMLVLGGRAATVAEARPLLAQAVADGSALEKLRQMVAWQHGNPASVDDFSLFARARGRSPLA
ncbi:MAG: thymidine phosphorylase, partial [Deltaproteobacteria bacterium]|nr:thymidine phosphorylase [Deltaproteobacteria bacterium]